MLTPFIIILRTPQGTFLSFHTPLSVRGHQSTEIWLFGDETGRSGMVADALLTMQPYDSTKVHRIPNTNTNEP